MFWILSGSFPLWPYLLLYQTALFEVSFVHYVPLALISGWFFVIFNLKSLDPSYCPVFFFLITVFEQQKYEPSKSTWQHQRHCRRLVTTLRVLILVWGDSFFGGEVVMISHLSCLSSCSSAVFNTEWPSGHPPLTSPPVHIPQCCVQMTQDAQLGD